MIFKNIFEDLNISKNDYFYLFILTVFSILITYNLIILNENIGIYCSDVFIYLSNSLVFAGFKTSRVYLYLSPFICFLTSILFRLGLLSEVSIYIVTGAFGILGNIGIYLFLKQKFNSLLSLCGAILFGSFSLNLLWWANGTLDVPAVALSIWTIIFIVLAIDKDSEYYLIAIPLLVLAIFTRYTTLFLLPLILLYYLSYHDLFSNLELLMLNRQDFVNRIRIYLKSEEFRNILKSCGVAFVLMIMFSATILASGSHLSFLTQGSTFASGSKGEVIDNAYTTDTFFYVHEFPDFLFADNVIFEGQIPILFDSGFVSYLLICLFAMGVILSAYKLFAIGRKKEGLENNSLKNNGLENSLENSSLGNSSSVKGFSNKYFAYSVAVLFIALLFVSILSFKYNSIITIIILLIDLVILFSFLKKKCVDRDEYSLNVLCLAWFLIYFIFFTFLNIKVNRYIITTFPAFIYFVMLAMDEILNLSEKYKLEFKSKNILNIIPIVLIVFCIFSAFAFPSTVHFSDDFNKNHVIADYLMEYDSDYSLKGVAVYNQRSLNWYLKTNTIPLTDDQLDYLESSNITYYISDDNFKLENYTMIYQKDSLYLYERISK